MNPQTRFQLKQSTGWFAAGREVACALQLLSDATFKLFLWLCLHAQRSQGTVSATTAELARVLGKSQSDVMLALQELQQRGVCTLPAENIIQIEDRFWPYQRQSDSPPGHDLRSYVEQVKRLFLERRCVQSSFTAADEKLARSLDQRGVSLIDVERAILLGAARKYAAIRQNGQSTPISTLHYFTQLFEEIQQTVSPQYWSYVARKVKTFEQAQGRSQGQSVGGPITQTRGC